MGGRCHEPKNINAIFEPGKSSVKWWIADSLELWTTPPVVTNYYVVNVRPPFIAK